MTRNILNLFNKILENNKVDTITGEILEYNTGNIYKIVDIYNTTYKYNAIHNKYYIEFEDGTQIDFNNLDTFIFQAKWLNS